MLKSELTSLLKHYNDNNDSFITRFSKESGELRRLRAIYRGPRVNHLQETDALSESVLKDLQILFSESKNRDEWMDSFLKDLDKELLTDAREIPFTNYFKRQRTLDLPYRAANMSNPMTLYTLFKDVISPVLDEETSLNLMYTCKDGASIKLQPDSILFIQAAQRLLQLVMQGKQIEAEKLIQWNPHILEVETEATDYSGRTVVTKPLKYAVWAGDWYMYKMILKYLGPTTASLQIKDLDNRGLGVNGMYGRRFNFTALCKAYETFINRAAAIWIQQTPNNIERDELDGLWRAVTQEQIKLPVHVINQFFHPDRSFVVNGNPPEFNEETLPRCYKFADDRSVFSRTDMNQFGIHYGQFGVHFGLARGADRVVGWRWSGREWEDARIDFAALKRLIEVIKINYEQIFKLVYPHPVMFEPPLVYVEIIKR